MARVLVTCCSRCGASFGSGDWTKKDGIKLHICPDGIIGQETTCDVSDPSDRPILPGFDRAPDPGECPNCKKQLIHHAKGYPACLSCGAQEVEPKTYLVPFGNWVRANDRVGRSFLMAVQADASEIAHILLDEQGLFAGFQFTTKAAQERKNAETRPLRYNQNVKLANIAIGAAMAGVPLNYEQIMHEATK